MQECMDATPDGELVVMDVSGWHNANDRIGLSVKKHYVKPAVSENPGSRAQACANEL
jgi:hypothetical protein